ncbi:conserved protein of unknown function [Pseudomonas marincola]|uniref:Uncharacterized protein n=1 Tax=Pseudomonas marincola TaxID=437900 RepID=A0A653DZQ7_9PSED|nr:conserved protein of unknown function [Pseudomonas marincola]
MRVELLNARQQAARQFFGGKLFSGESAGDLGQIHLMHAGRFPLLDDFRNEVQAVFYGWRNLLIRFAMIFFGYFVGSQALSRFERVSQRLNARGIDCLHLVDESEDAVECLCSLRNFAVIQA